MFGLNNNIPALSLHFISSRIEFSPYIPQEYVDDGTDILALGSKPVSCVNLDAVTAGLEVMMCDRQNLATASEMLVGQHSNIYYQV